MRSQQRLLLQDLFESLPSLVFILIWRQSGDLEIAGWSSALIAGIVFLIFGLCKFRMSPIMLGVNCHILLATPLIVGIFRLGFFELGTVLAAYAHSGVLLTVLLSGFLLSLFSRGGFIGDMKVSRACRRRYSGILLSLCAAGAIWALFTPESSLIPVIVTLTVLIGVRRFLLARHADSSNLPAIAGITSLPEGGSSAAPLST